MKKIIYISILAFNVCYQLPAQTPTDAVMMKQKESCFAAIYEHGTWNHYWEGTKLRKNETVAELTRQTALPMIAIGLHDKINLIVAVPYVSTKSSEPNGGYLAGQKGFQDLNLAIKAEFIKKELGPGKLVALSTIGFSTPISNYLSDYRPYSIGFGANELSFRAIAQYKFSMGIYVRGMAGYLWRGQTKAERDYYYNNGSYYTAWMDVPSAWNYNIVAGISLFENSLLVEGYFISLKSTSGDDIRKYNAAQPTNKVSQETVGAKAQYYFKAIKGVGLLSYYNQVINGRNTGKFGSVGAGITYQFKI